LSNPSSENGSDDLLDKIEDRVRKALDAGWVGALGFETVGKMWARGADSGS
jgi:hypothetical protein